MRTLASTHPSCSMPHLPSAHRAKASTERPYRSSALIADAGLALGRTYYAYGILGTVADLAELVA